MKVIANQSKVSRRKQKKKKDIWASTVHIQHG